MRTLTKVSIDNEVMTSDEAAEFLELRKQHLLSILNRNPEFGYKGFTIARVSEQHKRKGTVIRRASDHKEWNSIKDCAADLGLKANTVEAAIRMNQRFEHDGQTYFAPFYQERHRVSSERSKKLDITKLNQQELDSVKVENTIHEEIKEQVKQVFNKLTTEQEAFAALQKLAIERIHNSQYDKASKVLNALQILIN